MKGRKHKAVSCAQIGASNKGKLTREKNPNWKGGSYITFAGYRRIWVGDIIGSYKGYKLEHRHVLEQSLGRFLEKSEIVHHVNEDKLDNRIENLCILSNTAHMKIHYPTGSKFGVNNPKHK